MFKLHYLSPYVKIYTPLKKVKNKTREQKDVHE
jgi:hypothetical protein